MIKRLFAIAWFVALLVAQTSAQSVAFPKGEIKGPFVWKSSIYPGTERSYWVYVPKQYDAAKPACTMILQDGLTRATGWKLPQVLDSLIALKEIPPIIGIFVDPGIVPAAGTDNWPRFNRSFEYDALGDRYARFLIEEILPEVSKTYNLSKDPNDRSIAGASSGAICAFNAAWERPDQFRRVLSTIGTYVGLRGGDEFPTLVRKTEPKPLRVFLEDGSGDLNIYGGDWWTANQAMLSALTWAGYEVNHVWGTEGHNSKGAVKILPEALKWLWKDYPQPVKTHPSPVQRFNPVLENEPWIEIPTGLGNVNALAANKNGDVFFTAGSGIYKLGEGSSAIFAEMKGSAGGLTSGPDGKLYVTDPVKRKIIALDGIGKGQEIASNVAADFMAASPKGLYFTNAASAKVSFFSFSARTVSSQNMNSFTGGIALTSDQTFLYTADQSSLGYSMKINDDGALSLSQEYTHYHIPYGATTTAAGGMTVDSENRLYTATNMGIQITDQLGRVNFIINTPSNNTIDVKFGGSDFSTLYIIDGGKLYSRKVSTKGVLPFLPPVKPPKPGL